MGRHLWTLAVAVCMLLTAGLSSPAEAHGNTQNDDNDGTWFFLASAALDSPIHNYIYDWFDCLGFVSVTSGTDHFVQVTGPANGVLELSYSMQTYETGLFESPIARRGYTGVTRTLTALGIWKESAGFNDAVEWAAENFFEVNAYSDITVSGIGLVGANHSHQFGVLYGPF